jgi:hypothetical protein
MGSGSRLLAKKNAKGSRVKGHRLLFPSFYAERNPQVFLAFAPRKQRGFDDGGFSSPKAI